MTDVEVVKVKMQVTPAKVRIFFAHVITRKPAVVTYLMVTKDGDMFTGPKGNTKEYFMGAPGDVVWEKPAKMNTKYGELEVM